MEHNVPIFSKFIFNNYHKSIYFGALLEVKRDSTIFEYEIMNLDGIYDEFKKQNPNIKVVFSEFYIKKYGRKRYQNLISNCYTNGLMLETAELPAYIEYCNELYLSNLKIAFDVDGVLLDFYRAFAKKVNIFMDLNLKDFNFKPILDNFEKVVGDIDFWSTIPNLTHPSEINFEFDKYLTSMPKQHLAEREKNLKDNGFPKKDIIVSDDKSKYCVDNDIDVLIDDRLETIQNCKKRGVGTILFTPYYFDKSYSSKHNFAFNMKDVRTRLIEIGYDKWYYE